MTVKIDKEFIYIRFINYNICCLLAEDLIDYNNLVFFKKGQNLDSVMSKLKHARTLSAGIISRTQQGVSSYESLWELKPADLLNYLLIWSRSDNIRIWTFPACLIHYSSNLCCIDDWLLCILLWYVPQAFAHTVIMICQTIKTGRWN